MKNYINERLKEKKICLMTHIICGYPSFEANWEMLEAMDEVRVDVVEMQFPFSEPVADGPVFALANQKSIESGTKIDQCFDFMKKASTKFSFKILMMGYYNTVFKMGEEAFCKKLKASGGSGMIIPDLPLEESATLRTFCDLEFLDWVALIAPTNTQERITEIADSINDTNSFVYAVARKGVTGSKTNLNSNIDSFLNILKLKLTVPISLGFGIKSKEDVNNIIDKVEMAVMGTVILQTYEKSGKPGLLKFLKEIIS